MRDLVADRPRTIIWSMVAIAVALELLLGALALRSDVNAWIVVTFIAFYIGVLIVMGAFGHHRINETDRFYSNEAKAMLIRMEENDAIEDLALTAPILLHTTSLEVNLTARVVTMINTVPTNVAYSELKDLWMRNGPAIAYEFPLVPVGGVEIGGEWTKYQWEVSPVWTLRNWELTA